MIFGRGALEQLGPVAREHGLRRPLLVADRGLVAAGHVDCKHSSLNLNATKQVTPVCMASWEPNIRNLPPRSGWNASERDGART